MSIFDVMGPIMIGPSSSHTAGAARLGRLARCIAGGDVEKAILNLHGSFATTRQGHGTDRALLGGLMGFSPDDRRIRTAFQEAEERGLGWEFREVSLSGVHPNTVLFQLGDGVDIEIRGSSIGGGEVMVDRIDNYEVEITGRYDTLWVVHEDRPGMVGNITSALGSHEINIASMRNMRREKKGIASSVIELDQPLTDDIFDHLAAMAGIEFVRLIPALN